MQMAEPITAARSTLRVQVGYLYPLRTGCNATMPDTKERMTRGNDMSSAPSSGSRNNDTVLSSMQRVMAHP